MRKNPQINKNIIRISTLPSEIFTVEYWRKCYNRVAPLMPKRGRLQLLAKQNLFFNTIEGIKCYGTVRDNEGSLERTREVVLAMCKYLKITEL